MNKQTMYQILCEIKNSSMTSSLTGGLADGVAPFIATYNKLRKKALSEGWIDEDIVVELDLKDESLFGSEIRRHNVERMDVIGAAVVIFAAFLKEDESL